MSGGLFNRAMAGRNERAYPAIGGNSTERTARKRGGVIVSLPREED